MAYNYYPTGYSPYYPAYPSYQAYQPMQQPVQQSPVPPTVQQPQMPQAAPQPSTIIWVQNAKAAFEYPVAPNNAIALWDSTLPVIYLKQADASGKPTTKIYDLVERSDAPTAAQNPPEEKQPVYATKGDLDALAGSVSDTGAALTALRRELERLKDDLYGEDKVSQKKGNGGGK